jgi:hypothetical protein
MLSANPSALVLRLADDTRGRRVTGSVQAGVAVLVVVPVGALLGLLVLEDVILLVLLSAHAGAVPSDAGRNGSTADLGRIGWAILGSNQ